MAAGTIGIERIQISDFRAFPALAPADILLSGKNLLAFGENGAGKSSIYRALRGLFSSSAQEILPLHNQFTDPPQPSVKITLTDNTELHWSAAGHPTAAVQDVARKSAFLSHTRLIEMNTGTTPEVKPDIFNVAVDQLLGDFEAIVSGGNRRTVAELWGEVKSDLSRRQQYAGGTGQRRPKNFVAVLQQALDQFNDGMKQAIGALEGNAKSLLRTLVDVLTVDSLELVGFTFYDVNYDEVSKELRNASLSVDVKFREYSPPAHQNFLNEGRQSALAIAIYLAGRLACVPAIDTGLRILALDDLLLSLDHNHRRPVLDVIADKFKDWQIILLTHDRFWFEMAREHLDGKRWKFIEIYERTDAVGLLRPVIWESSDNLVNETLKQAKRFLTMDPPQPAASANYARTACEMALRRYCKNHGLEFAYCDDPQKIKLDTLLHKVAAHAASDPDRKAAIDGIKQHKKLILNPLSHNPTQPIVEADVSAALAAVGALVEACARKKAP